MTDRIGWVLGGILALLLGVAAHFGMFSSPDFWYSFMIGLAIGLASGRH